MKKLEPRTTGHEPRIENENNRGSWPVNPSTPQGCGPTHTPGVWKGSIRWIPETTSTNSAVLEMARRENLKLLVLVADHQTDGRGQFGRKWLSRPGENLLFSIYFEPNLKPSEAAPITQLACQAVVEVLAHYQIPCEIKKPNDVLVNGKKICGILTESSSKGENLEYVIVGIGLNVNSTAETLLPEATSMSIASSRLGDAQSKKLNGYDRTEVLNRILTEFEKLLNQHFSVIPDKSERRDPGSKLRFPLSRE